MAFTRQWDGLGKDGVPAFSDLPEFACSLSYVPIITEKQISYYIGMVCWKLERLIWPLLKARSAGLRFPRRD